MERTRTVDGLLSQLYEAERNAYPLNYRTEMWNSFYLARRRKMTTTHPAERVERRKQERVEALPKLTGMLSELTHFEEGPLLYVQHYGKNLPEHTSKLYNVNINDYFVLMVTLDPRAVIRLESGHPVKHALEDMRIEKNPVNMDRARSAVRYIAASAR